MRTSGRSQARAAQQSALRRLGCRTALFLERFRACVWSAVLDEHARAAQEAETDADKSLFDKLSDPPPHLDVGDMKYFDGKFRYF